MTSRRLPVPALLLVLLLGLLLVPTLASCGQPGGNGGNTTPTAAPTDDASPTDAAPTQANPTVESGDDLEWPSDAMGNLPVLDATRTDIVIAGGLSSVLFTDLDAEVGSQYIEALKELGYGDGMEYKDDVVLSFTGTDADGASVVFAYDFSTREGTLTYSGSGG